MFANRNGLLNIELKQLDQKKHCVHTQLTKFDNELSFIEWSQQKSPGVTKVKICFHCCLLPDSALD